MPLGHRSNSSVVYLICICISVVKTQLRNSACCCTDDLDQVTDNPGTSVPSTYLPEDVCLPAVLLWRRQWAWCEHGACGGAVAVLVTWYTSGLGYLMSVVMAPQNSMVAAVAVCMIVGGFLNGVEPRYRSLSPVMKHVFGELDSMPVLSS